MGAPPSWFFPEGIGEVQRARIERDWKHRERRSGSRTLPPVAPPVDIGAELEAFRAVWEKNRRWGFKRGSHLRFPAKLPPLSHEQAEAAREDAFEHYYRPGGHADLRVSALLRSDTYDAIEAARAEHRTLNGKPPKLTRLRQAIRERDGDDCWICHHELGDDCTIEHKTALANGGTWAFDNLALAHCECNRALGRLPVQLKEAVRHHNAALNEEWGK